MALPTVNRTHIFTAESQDCCMSTNWHVSVIS